MAHQRRTGFSVIRNHSEFIEEGTQLTDIVPQGFTRPLAATKAETFGAA